MTDKADKVHPVVSECKNRGGKLVRADGGCTKCEADAGEECRPPIDHDANMKRAGYRRAMTSRAREEMGV